MPEALKSVSPEVRYQASQTTWDKIAESQDLKI